MCTLVLVRLEKNIITITKGHPKPQEQLCNYSFGLHVYWKRKWLVTSMSRPVMSFVSFTSWPWNLHLWPLTQIISTLLPMMSIDTKFGEVLMEDREFIAILKIFDKWKGRMDGTLNGFMNEWTDGWRDGQTDRLRSQSDHYVKLQSLNALDKKSTQCMKWICQSIFPPTPYIAYIYRMRYVSEAGSIYTADTLNKQDGDTIPPLLGYGSLM